MNRSILVAIISLGVLVLARVSMGMVALVLGRASPISILWLPAVASFIVVGIVVRLRLAWQWGRLAGLVGGIVFLLLPVPMISRARDNPQLLLVSALLAAQAVPLIVMFVALSTKGARKHFHLACPQCGSYKVKAGDFLFTKAVCGECDTSWN